MAINLLPGAPIIQLQPSLTLSGALELFLTDIDPTRIVGTQLCGNRILFITVETSATTNLELTPLCPAIRDVYVSSGRRVTRFDPCCLRQILISLGFNIIDEPIVFPPIDPCNPCNTVNPCGPNLQPFQSCDDSSDDSSSSCDSDSSSDSSSESCETLNLAKSNVKTCDTVCPIVCEGPRGKRGHPPKTSNIILVECNAKIPTRIDTVLIKAKNKDVKVTLPDKKYKCKKTKQGTIYKSPKITLFNIGCHTVTIKSCDGKFFHDGKKYCLAPGKSVTFQFHGDTWYPIDKSY